MSYLNHARLVVHLTTEGRPQAATLHATTQEPLFQEDARRIRPFADVILRGGPEAPAFVSFGVERSERTSDGEWVFTEAGAYVDDPAILRNLATQLRRAATKLERAQESA
jgi:hypothetical protein